MQYTDSQIQNIVLDYVTDPRYKQAILIDGEWGSGKTHFVENRLMPMLKDALCKDTKNYVSYVSLYGVETVTQLSDAIYSSVMANMIASKIGGKDAAISKAASIFSKIALSGLSHLVDTEKLPSYSDFSSLKNVVLVLDDLERCQVHINSILGFLNNLVEHNEIKLIIIANQNEIGKTDLSSDLAQKYSVILHENYLHDQEGEQGKKSNSSQKLSANSLQQHTAELFGNNVLYSSLKEKLIGFTIKYQTNFETSFESLVNSTVNQDKTKSFLYDKRDMIIAAFEKGGHYNLRTLIYVLIVFERLHILFCELDLPNTHVDAISKSLLSYIIKISIFIKDGGEIDHSDMDLNRLMLSLSDRLINGDVMYKYVDEYVTYRIIDEEKFISTISVLVKEREENELNAAERNSWACNDLYEWWYLEDEMRDEVIARVYDELMNDKYPYYYYKDIIVSFVEMELREIAVNIEKYILIMTENVRKNSTDLHSERFIVYGDAIIVNRVNSLLQPIVDVIRQGVASTLSDEINSFFSAEVGWATHFKEYCISNHHRMNLERSFFAAINLDKLQACVSNTDTRSIYELAKGIGAVYSFSNLNDFFSGDLQTLKTFIAHLKGLDMSSKSRKMALDHLLNLLEESEKRLSPQSRGQ